MGNFHLSSGKASFGTMVDDNEPKIVTSNKMVNKCTGITKNEVIVYSKRLFCDSTYVPYMYIGFKKFTL